MLAVNDFRAYVKAIAESQDLIDKPQVVMDDSQITKFVQDNKNIEKYFVLGLIPSHKPIGGIDFLQVVDRASILLVKKVDRSEITHNQFLDNIHEAQQLAKAVLSKMLSDQANEECNIMKYLKTESIQLDPVWGLASCDGYEIGFSLETPF